MKFTIGKHNNTNKYHIFKAKEIENLGKCIPLSDSICDEVNINNVIINHECMDKSFTLKFALENIYICHNCRKDIKALLEN